MINLKFWEPKSKPAPAALPRLQMVPTPDQPAVRILTNPRAETQGPTTIDQFDQMTQSGQIAAQQANQEGWQEAQRARDGRRDAVHDARMADNNPEDQNLLQGQVALRDGSHVTTYVQGQDEERHQERFFLRECRVQKEWVTTPDAAIYGVELQYSNRTEVTTYQFLPNGTVREESQTYPSP